MLSSQTDRLVAGFRHAAAALIHERAGVLGDATLAIPEIELDRPKQAAHGDVACNLALQLAKPLRMNPRALAEDLARRVHEHDAGPGGAGLCPGTRVGAPTSVLGQRQWLCPRVPSRTARKLPGTH